MEARYRRHKARATQGAQDRKTQKKKVPGDGDTGYTKQ
jgi:hypothetical protein